MKLLNWADKNLIDITQMSFLIVNIKFNFIVDRDIHEFSEESKVIDFYSYE